MPSQMPISAVVLVLVVALLLIAAAFVVVVSVARKKRLEDEKVIARLRFSDIRNRITPHFIFNILNSRLDKVSEGEKESMVRLSNYLRSSLEIMGKNIVTLKEELHFVDCYVDTVRESTDFEYFLDAPNEELLGRITIPSTTIQILVENCVKHALPSRKGDGRIWTTVTYDDSVCTINVRDNGPGFDIRSYDESVLKNGLKIIKATFDFYNRGSKCDKMTMEIVNRTADDGTVEGSSVTLRIPDGILPPL